MRDFEEMVGLMINMDRRAEGPQAAYSEASYSMGEVAPHSRD